MSIEIEVVAAGPPGPRGYTGNTGPTGPQGAKGDKGDTGNTGAKGDKGDTGNTGAKGDKGDTGNTGAKGDKGDTGAKGDKGDTGNTGAKGDKGDQGDQGVIGPTPSLSIGTVGTGAAAASLTGTSEAPVLNLTLPSAGANGVDTAAIQDSAVTSAKIADGTIATADIADGAVTVAKLGAGCPHRQPAHREPGSLPGLPVVGQSHIATNGALHLSGTGSPEGVVTAAPGSTWLQTDATTDVKGWIRWVKATGTGNTGWVAGAEADTGWRDVSSLIPAAHLALNPAVTGMMTLRRVGAVVTVHLLDYSGVTSPLPRATEPFRRPLFPRGSGGRWTANRVLSGALATHLRRGTTEPVHDQRLRHRVWFAGQRHRYQGSISWITA
jgi:hypothetical protein